jgi:hypothetical protein
MQLEIPVCDSPSVAPMDEVVELDQGIDQVVNSMVQGLVQVVVGSA